MVKAITFKVFKQGSGTFRDFVHVHIIDNVPSKFLLSPEEFKELKKLINAIKLK